jgi:hypothetical protein
VLCPLNTYSIDEWAEREERFASEGAEKSKITT